MAARRTYEAAAGEVAVASSQLQLHIDQEMKRATPADDAGDASAAEAERLLAALHGCTRQLARLRDTLLVQADMPHEPCSDEARRMVIVEEGHKAQSDLLHAQQVADDMYRESLAQLSSTEADGQTKVLLAVDTCDRTNAATAGALSAIISALSDLSSSHSSRQAGSGGSGGSGAVPVGISGIMGFGGSAGAGADQQETGGRLHSAPPSSLGKGKLAAAAAAAAGVATDSVVTPKGGAAASAAPAPVPAAKAGRNSIRDGGISSSGGGGVGGVGGLFNPGIPRSATARNCRSQSARLTPAEAQPRRRPKAPRSKAWGPASTTATATEVAVALGLNPVTRAGVHAAAEDRRRSTDIWRAAAVSGGGVGGTGAGCVGGAEDGSGAEFSARAESSVSGNRKLSPEEHRQNGAASPAGATRYGRSSSAGVVEKKAAPVSSREVGSRDEGVKLAAKRTAAAAAAAAATRTSASRKPSRGAGAPAPAAAVAGAATTGGRDDGHRASPAVTGMLASPSGVRHRSDRSMRGVQTGGGSSSHPPSSAGQRAAALAARPRLSAGAGGTGTGTGSGSGSGSRRHPRTGLSTADHDNNSSSLGRRASPGAGGAAAFREALDEPAASAFLEDADLTAFLSSGSSALGSPGRSVSTTRATRRQSLLELHSAAGGGGRGEAAGGSVATAAGAARQRRSHSVGRFSMASRGESESVGRFLAAAAAAAAAAEGAGGVGDGVDDGADSRDPSGMDADEAAARRFARQEQEAQAREDELLALRLAAREEEAAQRRAARRRESLLHRNARRNSHAAGLDNPAAAAAALAAALMGGGGGGGGPADEDGGGGAVGAGVSDAVRALQFQDIEANDYETLLALDEGGGEGGRCCAGGRGLAEEAVEAVLRTERAAEGRLGEGSGCAICMTDFELDDEIAVLPCLHAFHGACIRKWLLMRNRCPTDMQPVVPESPKAK